MEFGLRGFQVTDRSYLNFWFGAIITVVRGLLICHTEFLISKYVIIINSHMNKNTCMKFAWCEHPTLN